MNGSRSSSAALLLVGALALVVPAAATRGEVPRQAGDPLRPGPVTGNAASGKQLYYAHACYGCHGFGGETGARDLVGTGSPVLANEENFLRFLRLRADNAPLFPSTRMPNYPESSLSDAEARDIYAYIRSFGSNSPDVKDVPTLEAIIESASRPYAP